MRAIKGIVLGAALLSVGVGVSGVAWSQPESQVRRAAAESGMAAPWDWGGGIGFLAETPDDTAFTVNLFGDRYLNDRVSVGPLAQFGFTGDLALYAFSGQMKYWIPLRDIDSRTRFFTQAGVGIVHAAFREDDTSWIVPLGFGIDHQMENVAVYAAFLVNLTDLDTGRGSDADVMPGVTFGAKF